MHSKYHFPVDRISIPCFGKPMGIDMGNLVRGGKPGEGRYDSDSPIIDFIYGITFEIWEERGVELIHRYYGSDVEMFSLGGLSIGVDKIVQGTYDTLEAFPDRLLLPENILWSADAEGDYSSHRILSPMTNLGASAYGPATGKKVLVRTIADCFVQDGKITREWLIRDTLPIVQQLGFDPLQVARNQAAGVSHQTASWIGAELVRLTLPKDVEHPWSEFARQVLEAIWVNGELDLVFPHCAILYPDPVAIVSGLDELAEYASKLRATFSQAQVCVDHVTVQAWAHEGYEVAVRWTLKAVHSGDYLGLPATGKDVYILGSSHWRVAQQRVYTDWTVFDGIGVLAQLV